MPCKVSPEGVIRQTLKEMGKDLSTKYWASPKEEREIMEYVMTKLTKPLLNETRDLKRFRFQEQKAEAAKRWSELSGMDVGSVDTLLSKYTTDVEDSISYLYASEVMLEATHVKLMKAVNSKSLKDPNKAVSNRAKAEVLRLTEEMQQRANPVSRLETAYGRALAHRKNKLTDFAELNPDQLALALKEFEGGGDIKAFNALIDSIKGLDDLAAKTKITREFMKYRGGEKFMASLTEAWRGSLLLNSATFATNTISGISESIIIPLERWVGTSPPFQFKFADGHLTFDPAVKLAHDQAWNHIRYMGEGFRQGLAAGWQSLKHDQQFIDPYRGSMIEFPQGNLGNLGHVDHKVHEMATGHSSPFQITAENWGLDPSSVMGGMVDGMGKYFRLSFRFLGATDEVVKQTNYWASLKSKYHAEALRDLDKGVSRRDVEIGIHQKMKDHFEADGFTPKHRDEDALLVAQDATHTKQAMEGSIVQKTQQLVASNPALGMFLPFVRTPSDLINKAYQRTPLIGMISKRMRNDFTSGDPLKRGQWFGRQAIGTGMAYAGYNYYMEGKLTGSGPDDPKTNQIWRQTHQPNSILIDGKWVSYQKFDPTGMLFGVIANGMDAARNGALTADDMGDVVQATILSITGTIGDKSSLRGVTNAATLFSDHVIGKDMAVKNLMEEHVASWVPSLLTQATGEFDTKYIKEALGLIDKLKRKSPWHQDDLPDRFNWLTGKKEEVPQGLEYGIPMKPTSDDWVLKELVNLNHGFSGPTRSFDGIELSSHQYANYNKLMGNVKLPFYGNKTLIQALRYEMKSERYDYDIDRVYFNDVGHEEPIQVRNVKRLMRHYKAEAKRQLIEANPDLMQQLADREQPSFLQQ